MYIMPASPQSVIATSGDSGIHVGWSALVEEVTSYNVYYQVKDSSESPQTIIPTPAKATSVHINGLLNGTAYSVWVTAISSDSTESAPSIVINNIIPLGVPTQPGLSAALGPEAGKLTFTITPPSDFGDSMNNVATLTYRLYKDDSPLPFVTDISETTVVVGPSGLSFGISTEFTVVATNGPSVSNPSNAVTITPLDVPDAPLLTADAKEGFVILSLISLSGLGGDIKDNMTYSIYRMINSEYIQITSSNRSLTYTDNAVDNGVTYIYYAVSSNSTFSSNSENVLATPLGKPVAPTFILSSADNLIELTFNAVDAGVGSNYTDVTYNVYQDDVLVSSKLNDPSFSTSNISNGTQYTFTTSISNALFASDLSEPQTITPYGVPTPPTVTIKAQDSTIVLNITPPTYNGGSTSLSYVVNKNGEPFECSPPGEITDIDVVNGVLYTYDVYVTTNNSQSSTVSVSAMPLGALSTPILSVESNDGQVVLVIDPSSFSGAEYLAYKVYKNNVLSFVINGASGTEITRSNPIRLTNGVTTVFKVTSQSLLLESEFSNEVYAMPLSQPSQPGLTVVNGSNTGEIILTVTPPLNYGDICANAVELNYVFTQDDYIIIPDNTNANIWKLYDLTPGQTYNYTVVANNGVFDSIPSAEKTITVLNTPAIDSFVAAVDPVISQRVKLTLTLNDCGNGTPTGVPLVYEFKRGNKVVTADPSENDVWILDDEPVGINVSYTVRVTNQTGVPALATSNMITPVIYATVNGNNYIVAVVNPLTVDVGTIAAGTPVAVNTGTTEEPVYITAITANIAGEPYNSNAANAILVDAMETAIESEISSILVKRIFPGDTTPTNSLIELGTPAAPLTSVTSGGTKSTTLNLPVGTYGNGIPMSNNNTIVACDITPRTDGKTGSYILIKVQVDGVSLTDGFSIPIIIRDNSAPFLSGYPLYHFVEGAWKLLVSLPPYTVDPTGCTYSGILTENQDYAGLNPPGVPGAPGKPTTVAQVAAITVNYSAPTNIGSSAITRYRIYWTGANSTKGSITTPTAVTSFNVPNLSANTTYTFVVAAINLNGEGPDSQPSEPIQTSSLPPLQPICFLANAPVLTPRGYRRIDSLKSGDLVKLANGRSMEIKRVKVVRYEPSDMVNPFIIPKGTFGAKERLLISPSHRIAVPGRGMVEARNLGLKQWTMHKAFDYYNLELEKWDNMVVAGVEVESLAPIRRAIVTKEQFRQILVAKYGALASDPDVLARIFKTCHDIGNGLIIMPCFK